MKTNFLLSAAIALALAAGAAACQRHETGMGPAQKAGKAVDDAGEQVARKLHEPIDKANEAAQQVARSAEQARDQVKEATEDARRGLGEVTEDVGKKVERAGEKIQDSANK